MTARMTAKLGKRPATGAATFGDVVRICIGDVELYVDLDTAARLSRQIGEAVIQREARKILDQYEDAPPGRERPPADPAASRAAAGRE